MVDEPLPWPNFPNHVDAELIAETRKSERTRMLRAELWMEMAVKAQRWANDIMHRENPGEALPRPFEEWGDDDPFHILMDKYGLKKEDLDRALTSISDQCVTRSVRLGFEDKVWR